MNAPLPHFRTMLLTAALAIAFGEPALAHDQPQLIAMKQQAPSTQEKTPPAQAVPPKKEPTPRPKPEEGVKGKKAPAGPKAAKTEADELDKDAVQAVVDMSKRLSTLKNFNVKAQMDWEEVLDNGQKIKSVEQVSADVSPPHGLRLERMSPGRDRILFYDGKNAVLWGPVTRYYTSVPFTGNLAELTKFLSDKYAYEIPLADLFLWGRKEEDIKAIKAASYVGRDRIGKRVCDHYAFRQENADWQIWIDTKGGKLPCRYTITDLTDPAHPVFEATLEINPAAEFYDERFTFKAPKDAAEIPLEKAETSKDQE